MRTFGPAIPAKRTARDPGSPAPPRAGGSRESPPESPVPFLAVRFSSVRRGRVGARLAGVRRGGVVRPGPRVGRGRVRAGAARVATDARGEGLFDRVLTERERALDLPAPLPPNDATPSESRSGLVVARVRRPVPDDLRVADGEGREVLGLPATVGDDVDRDAGGRTRAHRHHSRSRERDRRALRSHAHRLHGVDALAGVGAAAPGKNQTVRPRTPR